MFNYCCYLTDNQITFFYLITTPYKYNKQQTTLLTNHASREKTMPDQLYIMYVKFMVRVDLG